ncbi:MAG: cupin domain-containing protein [Chloroflexi bacterium]|nr:cupin domain-containing protein [Chloroflexota bacterium]
MPYVPPSEALNLAAIDVDAIREQMGRPPWRKALVATPATRWVLWEWPAGYVAAAHHHPRADEVFHVLHGRAVFRFGAGGIDHLAGPGTVLFAPRGVPHAIVVPGPESLLLLVSVTPNEDAPDETVLDAPSEAAQDG